VAAHRLTSRVIRERRLADPVTQAEIGAAITGLDNLLPNVTDAWPTDKS
jgi:hypothetical protein